MFTVSTVYVLLFLLFFAFLLAGLILLARLKPCKKIPLSARVGIALVLGLVYGVILRAAFPAADESGNAVLGQTGKSVISWTNIVGSGFVNLLKLVIVPLVFVSIISAISKTTNAGNGAKKAGKIIGFLLSTTAVVAVISICFTYLFGLSADKLIAYNPSVKTPTTVSETLLNLIPSNLFAALSGSSVLPVVFVSALIGFAYAAVKRCDETAGKRFESFIETAHSIVGKIVEFVIELTPYGVMAIIAGVAADGNWAFVWQLMLFIGASFACMLFVLILHLGLLWILGINPVKYLKKTGTALIFAFTSRSSAATLPLTIKALKALDVDEASADFAGTLGTCIGQHGCAGVYPVMVALVVGLSQGWNVWSLAFLIPLVLYVVLASIGTAGVGGGATQVSLLVLSLCGLPIELVGILVSVDFLIDMGRTALNVNDSILAGVVVGRKREKLMIEKIKE